MISLEAESAIISLQRRGAQARDTFESERIDRALDEIVRNPENTSPAAFQVRSALANASKAIQGRRAIVAMGSLEQGVDEGYLNPAYTEAGFLDVDNAHWIEAAPLGAADRAVLRGLAVGHEAVTLAAVRGISEQRMRETISRVRRRAKMVLRAFEDAA